MTEQVLSDEEYGILCEAFDFSCAAATLVNSLIDQAAAISETMGATYLGDLIRLRSLLEIVGISMGEYIPEHIISRADQSESGLN